MRLELIAQVASSGLFRERREPLARAVAADAQVTTAVGRELEQPRDARRPQIPARLSEREMHRRRQCGPHLRLRYLQIAGLDPGAVGAHRQADRRAIQARERAHDRRGRSAPIEHLARPARDDRRRPAA
jgi:hypothetical protein